MSVAFFLAIAFFLFLLWRERRGDLEAWSDLSRRTFYGAIVLAVAAIGALIGLRPTGADAIAFFAVLACCVWAIWRVWRREHRYAGVRYAIAVRRRSGVATAKRPPSGVCPAEGGDQAA